MRKFYLLLLNGVLLLFLFRDEKSYSLFQINNSASQSGNAVDEVFKFPWNYSQSWTYSQSWHGSNSPTGYSLDFFPSDVDWHDAWLLAPYSGEYEVVCNDGYQAYIQLTSEQFGTTKFLHLDSDSMSSNLPQQEGDKAQITQGQVLARGYNSTEGQGFYQEINGKYVSCQEGSANCSWYQYSTRCGVGKGLHFHWTLPSKYAVVDGWTIDESGKWKDVEGNEKYKGAKFMSTNHVHDFSNLILNSDFEKPIDTFWEKAPDDLSINSVPAPIGFEENGNVLVIDSLISDDISVIYQDIPHTLFESTPFEITIQFANPNNHMKWVDVKLHRGYVDNDSTGFGCRFALLPNTPLQTYAVHGVVNATADDPWDRYIRFETAIVDHEGGEVVIDDVRVEYVKDAPEVTQTECYSPLVFAYNSSGGDVTLYEDYLDPNSNRGTVFATDEETNWWEPTDKDVGVGRIIQTQTDQNNAVWVMVQWIDNSLDVKNLQNGGTPNQAYWVKIEQVKPVVSSNYSDVFLGDLFFDYIVIGTAGNLFQGYSTGAFNQSANITRCQSALTIVRWYLNKIDITLTDLSQLDSPLDREPWPFTDVQDKGNPCHIAVEYMWQKDWVNGKGDKLFHPDDGIIRAEFITMLMEALKDFPQYNDLLKPRIEESPKDCQFTDEGFEESVHKENIIAACKLGFVDGYSDGRFGHDDLIERNQAAKILSNAFLEIGSNLNGSNNQSESFALKLESPLANINDIETPFNAGDELLSLRWLARTDTVYRPSCSIFAAHDDEQFSSQLFRINLTSLQTAEALPTSSIFIESGISTLDIDPINNILYTVRSYDGTVPSELYATNPFTGESLLIDELHTNTSIPLKGVSALSFNPDGTLWGYAYEGSVRGIFTIDPHTAVATLVKAFNFEKRGMAWQPDGSKLWFSHGTHLFSYKPGDLAFTPEHNLFLPGVIEALEFRPDGRLWISIHDGYSNLNIYTFDVETGKILTTDSFSTDTFDNVTGLAWPDWCESEFPALTTIEAMQEGSINGAGASLAISANTLPETTTFSMAPLDIYGHEPIEVIFAKQAIQIRAYVNGQFQESFTFSPTALLTLTYDDVEVSGIDENSLYLGRWNEVSSLWESAACGEINHLSATNSIQVPICTTGSFALFGDALFTQYIPVVIK